MEISIGSRFKRAWNAFQNRDPTPNHYDQGASYSYRPDRARLTRGKDRSIATSLFNRIALDVAAMEFRHVQLDENGRFLHEIDSRLNRCLSLEANKDQTPRSYIQDTVLSMLDEGVVAMTPIDTLYDPNNPVLYDIETLRTGKILQWRPNHVRVNVYNDRTGFHDDLVMLKNKVGIVENPLYPIVNEPNSTLQRLMRKLSLLDAVDEQSGSGKLDMIIQLPYVIKTEARRKQAEDRRKDIEMQLSGSKYGIAYTDGTERITQLNRPVENNLLKQVEYLTSMLHSQLGMTQSILDGTADERTMNNYYHRTIEPIAAAIADEMKRKFLTQEARDELQSIMFFRDPFKLIPVTEIASIADTFTRNEIMTSNEIRQEIGMKPANDPGADELRNKNLSMPSDDINNQPNEPAIESEEEIQNGEI